MKSSEKFWDKIAASQEKQFKKKKKLHFETVEITKNYLNADDRVLDFGCGLGIKTGLLAKYVKEIDAMDSSPGMIDAAKRRAEEQQIKNVNFVTSNC